MICAKTFMSYLVSLNDRERAVVQVSPGTVWRVLWVTFGSSAGEGRNRGPFDFRVGGMLFDKLSLRMGPCHMEFRTPLIAYGGDEIAVVSSFDKPWFVVHVLEANPDEIERILG